LQNNISGSTKAATILFCSKLLNYISGCLRVL